MVFLQGIIAIISIFIIAPSIVFGFILLSKKEKNRIEVLKYQKEIIELEIRKDELKMKLLEEENRKYDRIIEERSRS